MTQVTAPSGRFVWYDLMTTDLEKSIHFYSRLFGWHVKKTDMGPEVGPYHMIESDGQDIGGMVELKEEGLNSHWLGYLTVDDVDQAADAIVQQAGSVPHPPQDIPNVGRFCIAGDPGGAYFAPFKFTQGQETPEASETIPGHFCWNELHAPKAALAKCKDFYRRVIGWGGQDEDMGPMGTYTLFKRSNGKEAAGLTTLREEGEPGYWLSYVAVANVDASVEQAKEHGAELSQDATEIPNMGTFAVLEDPVGASFALWK
ncbi:MAG TPA: VOC family protein [Acidobacteriota bacterium]|nr:VOC family protein [Acidobacteriota bacterium]